MEPVKYPWHGFYKYMYEKKEANTSPHYKNRNLATAGNNLEIKGGAREM